MHVPAPPGDRLPPSTRSVPRGAPAARPLTGPEGGGRDVERSDEDLLALVAARDVDALAALYDRHRAVAYGVALRVTGSVPGAEDVLQEAFLGVWRNADRFEPSKGSGRGWLLAIVHNRAIDTVRRRRSVDSLPDNGADPPNALVGPDVWPEVAGRLDAAAVRQALASLPEAQREAIELAYWGGFTHVEIAERTGQSLGTVKGRMRLGLRALGRSLSGADDDRGASGGEDAERAVAGSWADSTSSANASADTVRGRATAPIAALWARVRRRRAARGLAA